MNRSQIRMTNDENVDRTACASFDLRASISSFVIRQLRQNRFLVPKQYEDQFWKVYENKALASFRDHLD